MEAVRKSLISTTEFTNLNYINVWLGAPTPSTLEK